MSDAAAADPAETQRLREALLRLLPALERFTESPQPDAVAAYAPGTVPSEPDGLPEAGVGLARMVDELSLVVDNGCRISAPGFLGYITTGATTAGVLAHTATAVAGGQRYLLHAFNALEWTGLRWLADLCGLPAGVAGVFTSGGSTANLIALGAARQAAYERHGVDVAADGLPAGLPGRIYASEQAHRTVHRAAAVLGLGRGAVQAIPTDPSGRIDVDALDAALRRDVAAGVVPVATVAVAGTTDTGAVDPIDQVTKVARAHGSWVHVDGAYGLVARGVPEVEHLFAGVDEADSWIVDPHKWLATGLGVGATFVRDGALLTRAFTEGHAAYLEGSFADEGTFESQFDALAGPWPDQSVELSAPPRGVLVWAVLREIGRAGVHQRVARDLGLARALADRVRADERLELLGEPQLSITCFRYRASGTAAEVDRVNVRILERLRRETPFVPSSTVVGGAFALRACFINPRTTSDVVAGLCDAVVRFGDELVARTEDTV
jgi:aromatic-L-amino-acid decarboxylase